jgi:isopenicillin N synthase-like dioxygenase
MSRAGERFEGMWQRLLLAKPAEPVETLVRTSWLQGPALFADLRQPPAIGARVQASCLAEVQPHEARIMACQEGFAGRLVVTGDIADWRRHIDFQPLGPLGDRGRLAREGDLLIEYGVEADYVEYWQLDRAPDHAPCAAGHFTSESDGRAAYLIQYGRHFAYARDRGFALPAGSDLAALLCDTDARQAQALIDCEISLGTVTPAGWRIDRSTLPWREGAILLGPEAVLERAMLEVADVDANGAPLIRRLKLLDLHSSFDFAFAPLPERSIIPLGHTIPVVDIAALGSGDPEAEAAAVAQLRAAASEVGFLHITGHGIAPAVTRRLQAAAKRFFDLPAKRKMTVYIGDSTNHRGYVPQGEENFADSKDRKEAYDLALDLPTERFAADHPMLGPNRWPDLPGFREDVMAYYAAAFDVGRRLLCGLAMALGKQADALDHLVVAPPSQLRLIHYPHDAAAQDIAGIGAHTDYECFTLLLATAAGLEVMSAEGEWLDVDPVPGALIVNIGDMMEFWSNGAFVATSHRVRKVAEERYSFPLFFALDYDVELAPLGKPGQSIRTGEHLYAQTVRTFRYLKDRADRGEIALPQDVPAPASFGQEARHRKPKLA